MSRVFFVYDTGSRECWLIFRGSVEGQLVIRKQRWRRRQGRERQRLKRRGKLKDESKEAKGKAKAKQGKEKGGKYEGGQRQRGGGRLLKLTAWTPAPATV